jgi:DNA polymerase elongation subunit (family B)
MRTLVIDIETVGESWSDFDALTQSKLTSWVDKVAKNDDEKVLLNKNVKDSLGLSPLTAKIVSLALYDVERAQGAVYYVGNGDEIDETIDLFVYKQRSERDLLSEFWEGVQEYDVVVTYNGRSFDLPFLLHRSVVFGIKPCVELMKYRYLSHQTRPFHVDLLEELTWYGAMGKRPSLHLFCRAYGIDSPKQTDACGDNITELFQHKKFRDIAQYNAGDVYATAKLYDKWFELLAPRGFVNITGVE